MTQKNTLRMQNDPHTIACLRFWNHQNCDNKKRLLSIFDFFQICPHCARGKGKRQEDVCLDLKKKHTKKALKTQETGKETSLLGVITASLLEPSTKSRN